MSKMSAVSALRHLFGSEPTLLLNIYCSVAEGVLLPPNSHRHTAIETYQGMLKSETEDANRF